MYLHKALVQPVDHLYCAWVRKGKCIRSKSNDVSILLMQTDVRHIWSALVDVPESP